MMLLRLRSSSWLYCTEKKSRDIIKNLFISWLTDYCRSVPFENQAHSYLCHAGYLLNTLYLKFEI